MDAKALTDSIMASVQAQIEDALASSLPGSPGNEVSKPKASKASGARSTRKVGKVTAQARKPKVQIACITAGDAWLALGADETYRPKDSDKPANNAQLWRLNQAGLLTIAQ